MAENIAKLRARDDGSLYQGGFAPAIPAQKAIMQQLALLAAKKNKDKVSIDGISESLNKDGKYIRNAVTGSITSTMNLGIDLYYYAKSFGKKYFSSAPGLDNSIEIFPSASGLQNPLEYIPKVPNDSFLPGLYKNPDDLLGLGNRISIFDGLPNDDNGRYITDRALGLLGGSSMLMADSTETKLTKGGNRAIGNLTGLKDKTAAEALKFRGGNNSAIGHGRSDYWSKSLGEIANLKSQGDQDAGTILKLIKKASKKAQKYGGK